MANPKYLKTWKRAPKSEPSQPVALQSAGKTGDYVSFYGIASDAAYLKWLAEARSISLKEALAYCEAMDCRTLISQSHKPTETAKPVERWRLKSAWWKPHVLRPIPFDAAKLAHQRIAYAQWMRERDARLAA